MVEFIGSGLPSFVCILSILFLGGCFVVFNGDAEFLTRIFVTILMVIILVIGWYVTHDKAYLDAYDKENESRKTASYERNKPFLQYKMDNGCEVYQFDSDSSYPKHFTKCPNAQVTTDGTHSSGGKYPHEVPETTTTQ